MTKKPVKLKENIIYAAVAPICEGRENEGSYKGNGHHLAQEITKAVTIALLPEQQKKVYDTLNGVGLKTGEIAEITNIHSKNVSTILIQLSKTTLLVSSKRKGKLRTWYKN